MGFPRRMGIHKNLVWSYRSIFSLQKIWGMKRTWAINSRIWEGKLSPAGQRICSSNSPAKPGSFLNKLSSKVIQMEDAKRRTNAGVTALWILVSHLTTRVSAVPWKWAPATHLWPALPTGHLSNTQLNSERYNSVFILPLIFRYQEVFLLMM